MQRQQSDIDECAMSEHVDKNAGTGQPSGSEQPIDLEGSIGETTELGVETSPPMQVEEQELKHFDSSDFDAWFEQIVTAAEISPQLGSLAELRPVKASEDGSLTLCAHAEGQQAEVGPMADGHRQANPVPFIETEPMASYLERHLLSVSPIKVPKLEIDVQSPASLVNLLMPLEVWPKRFPNAHSGEAESFQPTVPAREECTLLGLALRAQCPRPDYSSLRVIGALTCVHVRNLQPSTLRAFQQNTLNKSFPFEVDTTNLASISIQASGHIYIFGKKHKPTNLGIANKVISCLQELDDRISMNTYQRLGLIATMSVPFRINVTDLAVQQSPYSTLAEPGTVYYAVPHPKMLVLIHADGKLAMAGSNSIVDIQWVLKQLYPVLQHFAWPL